MWPFDETALRKHWVERRPRAGAPGGNGSWLCCCVHSIPPSLPEPGAQWLLITAAAVTKHMNSGAGVSFAPSQMWPLPLLGLPTAQP